MNRLKKISLLAMVLVTFQDPVLLAHEKEAQDKQTLPATSYLTGKQTTLVLATLAVLTVGAVGYIYQHDIQAWLESMGASIIPQQEHNPEQEVNCLEDKIEEEAARLKSLQADLSLSLADDDILSAQEQAAWKKQNQDDREQDAYDTMVQAQQGLHPHGHRRARILKTLLKNLADACTPEKIDVSTQTQATETFEDLSSIARASISRASSLASLDLEEEVEGYANLQEPHLSALAEQPTDDAIHSDLTNLNLQDENSIGEQASPQIPIPQNSSSAHLGRPSITPLGCNMNDGLEFIISDSEDDQHEDDQPYHWDVFRSVASIPSNDIEESSDRSTP